MSFLGNKSDPCSIAFCLDGLVDSFVSTFNWGYKATRALDSDIDDYNLFDLFDEHNGKKSNKKSNISYDYDDDYYDDYNYGTYTGEDDYDD